MRASEAEDALRQFLEIRGLGVSGLTAEQAVEGAIAFFESVRFDDVEAEERIVQDMLGHSSRAITSDTYTTVLPEVARAAAEAAAALMPGVRIADRGDAERA